MKISVIKSANEVVIGSLQITNEKLAKFMIRINDLKNNLKKRRYTHWVKVSFNGLGNIEIGDEPMCIGDYDEYPISPDTKVIIPIEDTGSAHKQYVCSTLNTPTLLQNKTLSENEEIIIVYTEIINEEGSRNAVNEMLLNAMKKCLFEYQMKVYTDHEGETIDKALFDKRVQQILNILPDLEHLIQEESGQTMQEEETVTMAEEAICWEEPVMEVTIPEYKQMPVLEDEEEKPSDEQIILPVQDEENIAYNEVACDETSDVTVDNAEMINTEEDKAAYISEAITQQEEAHETVKWVKIDLKGNNDHIE